MSGKGDKEMTAAERRKAKLAEELRANLTKRKAQMRARRDAPSAPGERNDPADSESDE